MIVIFGCGQMGKQLALNLERDGKEVTVIDTDINALTELSSQFKGRVVVGLGLDKDVLKKAGVDQAEAFLAVSRDLNSNIMASQVCKTFFKGTRVVARIENEEQIKFYKSLGIETVSPTMQAVEYIGKLIK